MVILVMRGSGQGMSNDGVFISDFPEPDTGGLVTQPHFYGAIVAKQHVL